MKIKFTKPGNKYATTKEFKTLEEAKKQQEFLAKQGMTLNDKEAAELNALNEMIKDIEETAARKAKQHAEAQAAAEARAKQQRQDTLDNIAKQKWTAEQMATFDARYTDVENKFREYLGETWLNIQEEIEGLSLRLLQNPADFFGWGDSGMKLAAKRELLDSLIHRTLDPQRTYTLAQLVSYCKEELTQRILSNYYGGASSSNCSNAMDAARRETVCEFLQGWSWGLVRWIEELTAGAKSAPPSTKEINLLREQLGRVGNEYDWRSKEENEKTRNEKAALQKRIDELVAVQAALPPTPAPAKAKADFEERLDMLQ